MKTHNVGTMQLKFRKQFLLLALCGCTVLASLPGQAWAGQAVTPPATAVSMTATELYLLYRDKTWIWADGAGRIASEGRRFTAWTGSGDLASWAEGRWIVQNDGHLCLKAEWRSSSGVAPSMTCFIHKRDRGTIYQRREPAGSWYIFKHARQVKSDEFNKLTAEDGVSQKLDEIKSSLDIKIGSRAIPPVVTAVGRLKK